MADVLRRKCVKCGSSQTEDLKIKLHRFPRPGPRNVRRCELWAKYCFPDKPWSCVNFQRKLYSEHRMLCTRHFKDSEFLNIEENRLSKFAVPDMNFDEDIKTFPFLDVDDLSKTAVGPSQPAKCSKNEKAPEEEQHDDQPESNNPALSDAADDAESSVDVNIPEPPPPAQLNLHTAQMCRVCLALDVKMFDLSDTELNTMFQNTTGITFEETEGSKLGSLICWECTARLKAASTFISKALFSESLLQGLMKKGEQIEKQYFDTLKEEADNLISPKTLTVTEIVNIVEIEDQNKMTQFIQSGDGDDEPPVSENCETEEIIIFEIGNSEMDVEGDKDVIETAIEDDSTCLYTEENNRTSSLTEYILGHRPLLEAGHTSLQSDSISSQEDCDNRRTKPFKKLVSKSKKVPKQNIKLKNPIKRSKEVLSVDHMFYLKRDSEDGIKNKKIKTYLGSSKQVSS